MMISHPAPLRIEAVVSSTSECGAVGVAMRVEDGSDGSRVDCLEVAGSILAGGGRGDCGADGGCAEVAGGAVYERAIRSEGRTIGGVSGFAAFGGAVVPKPSLASLMRSALLFWRFLSAIYSHRIGKTCPLGGMSRYRSRSAPGEASAQIANSVANGIVLNRLECLSRPTPRQ